MKARVKEFLKYVESQNQHSRDKLLSKMLQLQLNGTDTWRDIKASPNMNIGKNTIKGILLYNLVENMGE
jgi:hypothetical protein